MRRWLLLALIVLLPLRSWAGDAMASDMLVRHLAMAASAATLHMQREAGQPPHEHTAVAPDCASHHLQAPSDFAQASADPARLTDFGCATCASCQACSAAALEFTPLALPLISFAQATPVSPPWRFASADARQGDKPPRA